MGSLIPRLSVALCLCTGFSAFPVIADRDEPLTAVADLRYGVSLYNYYLDDYMSAMTELLIAEQRGGINGHGDNPEIMEGGLAMGYSMERYASEIFERLLEENRSVEARDAAWYYLAKLRYTHGEWARAEQALNKISEDPAKTLREDAVALRINVVLKQDRPAEAAALLDENRLARRWLPYFYFNIGSAFARGRDYASAVDYFEYLADEEFQTEEHRALYDKAMTAAGFAYLFQKQYAQSKEYFSRVRLSSSLKNRALLGYGWAAVEMGDYQEALKPWMHLASSPLVDENNQEALIAVPYAYEKMGAEALALERYQVAEASFVSEIEKIDEVMATLQNEDLLAALNIEQRGQLDWMSIAEEKQLSPRLTYLVRLFSQDRFQGSIHELQDLLAIRNSLIDWQDKLAFYSDMVDTREQSRVDQAEFLQVSELSTRIDEMRVERSVYAEKIENIAAEKDFLALATDEEQDLIRRARRSKDNVELLRKTDPFIDEYEESVRRYHGLLMWQASDTYSDRLWQAIKHLNKLDDAIEQVSGVESRVTKLMSQAEDLNPYRENMDEANVKLIELDVRIAAAILKNEDGLKEQVIEILREQRRRLTNYLAQSRLAVARIYDKARNQQEETDFEQLKSNAEAAKQAEALADPQSAPQAAPLSELMSEDGSETPAKAAPAKLSAPFLNLPEPPKVADPIVEEVKPEAAKEAVNPVDSEEAQP